MSITLQKKKKKIVLGDDSNGMLLTPEEFDAVEDYDENFEYELIHGVVVVNPIPLGEETGPNELLAYYLFHYQKNDPHGAVLDFTMSQQYVRTPNSRRIADRLIWTGLGRMPDRDVDIPTIAIELVSVRKRDRDRDYVEKRREYGKAGVKEYWIIDRFRRTMTVVSYMPRGTKERVVAEKDTYQTRLLPGFKLPLAQILEAADRLAQAKQKRRS
jgi:Uma2 family endonuclease